MQKTKILREIIETLEKHDSEFTVEKFNSDIIQCGAEQELISFNIKFDLKQKETAAVPEVPTAEIFPAGPGPKEENQVEEFFCESCGKKISWAENSYSNKHFSRPLCRACQAIIKGDK